MIFNNNLSLFKQFLLVNGMVTNKLLAVDESMPTNPKLQGEVLPTASGTKVDILNHLIVIDAPNFFSIYNITLSDISSFTSVNYIKHTLANNRMNSALFSNRKLAPRHGVK